MRLVCVIRLDRLTVAVISKVDSVTVNRAQLEGNVTSVCLTIGASLGTDVKVCLSDHVGPLYAYKSLCVCVYMFISM